MTTSTPIRVLHLVASSHGGGATHVRDLALRLPSQQYLTVVAMPEDKGIVDAIDFKESEVTFYPWSGTLSQVRAMASQVDVLHCHGARAAFWGRLAAVTLGPKRPKIVYSIHGFMIPHYSPPYRWLLGLQEKIQAPQVDRYIAVSHAEKKTLWQAGLGRDDKVTVIWYGIDTEKFVTSPDDRETLRSSFGVKPTEVLLAMVCRFFWPRDFDTLLHAYHLALKQAPSLRLLLVGDGPWRPRIERFLDQLDLGRQVILPGIRRDIVHLLHACDIFVLTSRGGDGLPISILEAMAAARPVIATATDGIPEEVIEGETGFVPPLRNVTELAEAMVKLAQNPDLRQTMGMAGQQRVQTFFKLTQMVDKIIAVYQELLTL